MKWKGENKHKKTYTDHIQEEPTGGGQGTARR